MGKAGRKRTAGVKRTASGRKSRAASAYQENADQIMTRMRLFGLSEEMARDQKAGSVVGRLELTKVISQPQYDAAERYRTMHGDYLRAIAAPDGTKQAGGPTAGPGETAEYATWCSLTISKWNALLEAVTTEQNLHRNRGANIYAALDYLVIRDEQHHHMVGDLRLGLNAIAHHLGIERKVFTRSEAA